MLFASANGIGWIYTCAAHHTRNSSRLGFLEWKGVLCQYACTAGSGLLYPDSIAIVIETYNLWWEIGIRFGIFGIFRAHIRRFYTI